MQKKFIINLLLSIVSLLLLAAVCFYAYTLVPLFLEQNQAGVKSEPEQVAQTRISPEMVETHREFADAFWNDSDFKKTFDLLKIKRDEILKRHTRKETLTKTELNDEMFVLFNYAVAARYVDPKESMRAYAEIYNNEKYTDAVKSEALFDAMYFLMGELGTNLTLSEVNEWIFSSAAFGGVLVGSLYEGKVLVSEEEAFSAAVIGFKKASGLTDSKKKKTKISALQYDLEVRLLTQDIIKKYKQTGGLPEDMILYAQANIDTETREQVELLLGEYETLERDILAGFSDSIQYPGYTKEFFTAGKNVLRAYTTLQSVGFDVKDRFDRLYAGFIVYAKRIQEDGSASDTDKKQMRLLAGVGSLYTACSYVLEKNYALTTSVSESELLQLLQPFLELTPVDQSRFFATNHAGENDIGYCYDPYVRLGQKIDVFKQALINGVGGWDESQFE